MTDTGYDAEMIDSFGFISLLGIHTPSLPEIPSFRYLRVRNVGSIMIDNQYPTLSAWVLSGSGWIELGQDEYSDSLVRILEIGGLLWESDKDYATLAEALADADAALKRILAAL